MSTAQQDQQVTPVTPVTDAGDLALPNEIVALLEERVAALTAELEPGHEPMLVVEFSSADSNEFAPVPLAHTRSLTRALRYLAEQDAAGVRFGECTVGTALMPPTSLLTIDVASDYDDATYNPRYGRPEAPDDDYWFEGVASYYVKFNSILSD